MALRSRPPSRSRRCPWCWSSAWRARPRCRFRCVALIQPGRRPGWLRGATSARQRRRRAGLVPMGRFCSCGTTVTSSWRGSARLHHCGWASPSRRRRWRPASQGRERGSATLVAVAMMAVVMSIALGGTVLGSAVIARHRAQASADLAALAAAGRLASGVQEACSWASSVAGAMHSVVAKCRVEGLDVIVGVDVPVALGRWGLGSARAAARAGPSERLG